MPLQVSLHDIVIDDFDGKAFVILVVVSSLGPPVPLPTALRQHDFALLIEIASKLEDPSR